jgi:hypothetical protein
VVLSSWSWSIRSEYCSNLTWKVHRAWVFPYCFTLHCLLPLGTYKNSTYYDHTKEQCMLFSEICVASNRRMYKWQPHISHRHVCFDDKDETTWNILRTPDCTTKLLKAVGWSSLGKSACEPRPHHQKFSSYARSDTSSSYERQAGLYSARSGSAMLCSAVAETNVTWNYS